MFNTLIDCFSLAQALGNPDWLIFDIRYDLMSSNKGRNAYLQGHIPGAIYVDLHDDLCGPPITNRGRHPLLTETAMNQLCSRLGITKDTQVVVYDDTFGSFAARFWWMLKHVQHERVAVLDGAWQAWERYAGPVSMDLNEPVLRHFSGSEQTNDVVNIDEVNHFKRIIDSRDPARFRGEIEPVDKVAGHIPGAINRFWKENLIKSGQFKEKRALADEFRQIFDGVDADECVFYCGSGVTACHNLLAANHAGLSMPRLYAGSWSEWSCTQGRAVATGYSR